MKRIAIVYAGREFSVGQEDLERLKEVIQAAHEAGRTEWITVNHGEGRPQPAELLVGPGIPIALMPIEGTTAENGTVPVGDASSSPSLDVGVSASAEDSLF